MSSNAEEHLERVQAARKARVEGFVRLLDLEYFLACDESYSLDTLDKINTIFQVGGFSHDGSWSKEHRHGFWLLVLLRWTGIRSNAFKAKLKPIGRYLPAYKYDTASGDYHRIPAAGTNAGLFDKIYLSLNEVAGYMAKIRDAYQIEIYLPEPLKVVEPAQLEQESGIKFQVPEGTGWDQVTITAIDFQHVKIKTPLGEKRVHYADLGWIDRRRTGHAKRQWGLLFDFLLNQNVGLESKRYKNLPKLVSDLSRDLKKLFGIQEKPFTGYGKKKSYSPKFNVSSLIDKRALMKMLKPDQESFYDEIKSEADDIPARWKARKKSDPME